MAGGALTTMSAIMCPHGGKVVISATRKISAGGAPIVNANDPMPTNADGAKNQQMCLNPYRRCLKR